ncbi:hypothetical protein HGI30_20555 [Paenibacillus albicereus]|uniref:Uncharacterized protein n=1 Tax=Paenibacillus albicereus TaxID=2726185 RepID=A0A6H2H2P1_9BACL|nr:hypothetical protein [Paenibacillus albicereus]QJC53686.1 hypothetical protein HGI30_20555 [Paenibacillus albicereus]
MVVKGWVTAVTLGFGVLVAIVVVIAYLRLYTRQQQDHSGGQAGENPPRSAPERRSDPNDPPGHSED